MQLAITVTAQRRPQHLARCLRSIYITRSTADPLPRRWDSVDLYVSIDESEVPTESNRCVETARRQTVAVWETRLNSPAFGLWERENNAFRTYEWAFETSGADAVLAVEDDCVLSPDALLLCDWFLAHHADEYLFLNLGHAETEWSAAGKENDLVERTRITSPWAWCFTRTAWESVIRPSWQCKTLPPRGWDWSLSYLMAQRHLKALVPVLPRAFNTGRELGANGGADVYDRTLGRMPWSDGTWSDPDGYQLVRAADSVLSWRDPAWNAEAEKDGVVIL